LSFEGFAEFGTRDVVAFKVGNAEVAASFVDADGTLVAVGAEGLGGADWVESVFAWHDFCSFEVLVHHWLWPLGKRAGPDVLMVYFGTDHFE